MTTIPGTRASAWSYSLSPNIPAAALSAILESTMIIKVLPCLSPHFPEPPCEEGKEQEEHRQLHAARGRKGREVSTGIMTLTCLQGWDRAGITTVPVHLEWKEPAPIPSPALSIHSDALHLQLNPGEKLILKHTLEHHQHPSEVSSSAHMQWSCYTTTCRYIDLSPPSHTHTHTCSHTPFRCNYIRNPFAKHHSEYLGAY